MCSGGSDWTCLQPGFPIRKSSDHSLVIDSPRLIADSYVLLRFLVPRHPPSALNSLTISLFSFFLALNACVVHRCLRAEVLRPTCTASALRFRYPAIQLSKIKNSESLKLNVEFALNTQPYSFNMVEVNGIEPMTSCVQGRRSPS